MVKGKILCTLGQEIFKSWSILYYLKLRKRPEHISRSAQDVFPVYRLVIGRRQSLPKAREVILMPGGL